ncbi:hypothetical protein EYB45_01095 [Erythrobacteraceae bacterium CFH 75059]|uniref:ion channel n=1 Tax=Qipengyuania thermophila TaxID=2509361 RepID=UPI00101F72EB|nr:ion channel [Qipengyuania thermophila]TCD06359.1 hypothetical protein EYB45_01095 [Erythrobacteraceae bacterium CFH 75059]
MSGSDWLMLLLGVLMLGLFGGVHLAGLEIIRRMRPSERRHPWLAAVLVFWSVGLLHLTEIALAAVLLFAIAAVSAATGALAAPDAASWLYFAGITFATLGFAQVEPEGPLRLLYMMLSVTGFMLITWSATFLHDVWSRSERAEETGGG